MAIVINGDTGEVGKFIEFVPTGKDGWVDVVFQPAQESFFQVLKCLVRKPKVTTRNVPESSITDPVIVGPPGYQREVIFMLQGENASSKLMDAVGVFHNKSINILRQQLQDEIIRAQAADEEKNKVLKGAKQTQKLLADLDTKKKPQVPYPFRARDSVYEEQQ